MCDHIRAIAADHILTLVIDRPLKKNALTDEMYGALADGIERAQKEPSIHVVVLRSEGDIFTAGNDLIEFAAADPLDPTVHVRRFVRALATGPKPIIAAVQGQAVGIGLTMLLHCDHVILAEGTSLSAPFVALGLTPEAGSSMLLPRHMGHLRAFSILALGEILRAEDAVALGLANAIVPADELPAAIMAIAKRIANQPTGAVIAAKRLMRDSSALLAQIAIENDVFAARLQSREAKKAFTAVMRNRSSNPA